MKGFCSCLILVLIAATGFAQNSEVDSVLKARGEAELSVDMKTIDVNTLASLASIGRKLDDSHISVFANAKELQALKETGAQFSLLQNNSTKAVNVASTREEMYSWNKYPTYSAYTDFMQYYAQTYSQVCRLDTIGTTNEGRLLLALKISSSPESELAQPKFFYSAAIHGNELTPITLMMRLIDTILTHQNDADISRVINNMQLYICPEANPDGTYAGGNNNLTSSTRYNANYVDLNRNFPSPKGSVHPDGNSTQAETSAFMAYARKNRFNMSANLHTGSEVFNYPFDTWRSSQRTHADRDWFEAMGQDFDGAIERNSATDAKYFRDVTTTGYVDGGDWYVIDGGRQDWHTYFAHCREVTVEVSHDYATSADSLRYIWNFLDDPFFVMLDYARKGFDGIVTDSISGQPLTDVMITVNSHDRDSSEVFSNTIGYYFRPALEGNYSVTFSKDGYFPKTVEVNCTDSLSHYNVALVRCDVSVENIQDETLSVWPNPARESIHTGIGEPFSYRIYSSLAEEVKTGEVNSADGTMDISSLDSGQYIICIKTAGGRQYSFKISVL